MLKAWTVEQVYELCRRIRDATYSNRYNKHAQWLCKQDLYRIKWAAEQAISQCAQFEDEEKFIKSYEHRQLLEAIKGDDASG
jgi:hypothetical protein